MKSIWMILFVVLVCGVSCTKRYNGTDGGGGTEKQKAAEEERNLYTEEEIKTLPREELMYDAGKTFYIIADVPLGEFCRRAVVFTEDDNGITEYLSIDGSVIRDRLGTIIIDGSKYGGTFYAWEIARYQKTGVGFYIYCYWKSPGYEASSTDPLNMEYDIEKDLIYIWRIDPKDL
jgi:hypothetical protein